MVKLPPLPPSEWPAVRLGLSPGVMAYTAEQMKAYGQQCRAAGLEEAAQVCDHKAETKRLYLNEAHYLECAEAIRSLK